MKKLLVFFLIFTILLACAMPAFVYADGEKKDEQKKEDDSFIVAAWNKLVKEIKDKLTELKEEWENSPCECDPNDRWKPYKPTEPNDTTGRK